MDNLERIKADYSHAALTELPTELLAQTKVQHLNLSSNQLTNLPDHFSQLQELVYLNLSNNPLEHFPLVLLQLPKLQKLILKRCKIKYLPTDLQQLQQLEQLNLSINPIVSLPACLAQMPQLTSLILEGNRLSKFPMVLLEMPQLQTPEKLDLKYRLGLSEKQVIYFFQVLRHLHLQQVPLANIQAAYYLLLEPQNTTLQDNQLLFCLLQVSYSQFAKAVRLQLLHNSAATPIQSPATIALVGKSPLQLELLNSLPTTISKQTTHIILGDTLTKKEIKKLKSKHCFVSAKQVLDALAPPLPTAEWLQENSQKIKDLLLSEQAENIALVLQMTAQSDMLKDYLTELLYAYSSIGGTNADLKKELYIIFYRFIPDFDQLLLPHSNFSFYTPAKSENAIAKGIENFATQTPYWNAVQLATILYQKYQAGYIYLLEQASVEQQKELLQIFIQNAVCCLSQWSELQQLPEALCYFPSIRILDLQYCQFRQLPAIEILRQLPNLTTIDLRHNPIKRIPQKGYTSYASYQILLTT